MRIDGPNHLGGAVCCVPQLATKYRLSCALMALITSGVSQLAGLTDEPTSELRHLLELSEMKIDCIAGR